MKTLHVITAVVSAIGIIVVAFFACAAIVAALAGCGPDSTVSGIEELPPCLEANEGDTAPVGDKTFVCQCRKEWPANIVITGCDDDCGDLPPLTCKWTELINP